MKIRVGLPEALDLMVICTEAGLGLDQMLYRVGRELETSQPEIRDELLLINLEQKVGRPREEALKNFADRVNIDSARSLAATLIQTDTFGTSIAKTLRVYSDTLRTQRRQKAEELAAKTTVKLVFPLVLFIFPSIFVVTLGPAGITMIEGFAKYFGN
jgi:tight adherence protein C